MSRIETITDLAAQVDWAGGVLSAFTGAGIRSTDLAETPDLKDARTLWATLENLYENIATVERNLTVLLNNAAPNVLAPLSDRT